MAALHVIQICLIIIGCMAIIGAIRILITGPEKTLGDTMMKLFLLDWIAEIVSDAGDIDYD